jgi:hypothetical protein
MDETHEQSVPVAQAVRDDRGVGEDGLQRVQRAEHDPDPARQALPPHGGGLVPVELGQQRRADRDQLVAAARDDPEDARVRGVLLRAVG